MSERDVDAGRTVDGMAEMAKAIMMSDSDALELFFQEIEATGGVYQLRNNRYEPVAATAWANLGEVYVRACYLTGRDPILVDGSGLYDDEDD